MKKKSILIFAILTTLIFGSCTKQVTSENTNDATTTATTMEEFTKESLADFNGKDGKSAYIAVNDKVYDVSNSKSWNMGEHNGITAGMDLTDQITKSPHGDFVLKGLPVVGTYTK